MQLLDQIPTLQNIIDTHNAIAPLIHHTPVSTSAGIDAIAGASLFFKCENFQKVGAFKMRGASSASLRLPEADRRKGIATHSSGNHAQAVALSAKLLGIPAYVVMPENAPAIKVAGVRSYGAEIVFCASNIAARESTLKEVVARTGAYFIHPYDDYNIIAGQATAAKELIETVPDLDVIIAPVGGGGLMSGTALATRYLSPGTKVYAAEPKAVDDAWRSMQSGKIEENPTTNTLADGLRTHLGEKTFDIIRREVDDVFTVSEEAMVEAMRLVWERMKIVIEPSAAVPVAAVLSHPAPFAGKRVGLILSGGNVDLQTLPF